MYLVGAQPRILQGHAARFHGLGDQVVHQLLELRPGKLQVQVLRPARVRRDEGQVDLGLLGGRKLDLGLLRSLFEPLQGHQVSAQVDALVLLELGNDPLDDPLIQVIPTQVGVSVRGLHLDHVVAHLEDGDVEGAASEVVHGDRLVLLLVQAVGQGGRRGLVDDPPDVQARDGPRVLGGLALAVVEIGRRRDHGIGHGLTEIVFRGPLQLLQNEGRDLRRGELLVPHLDLCNIVRAIDNLVRDDLDLFTHLSEAASHKPLYRIDRVLRVRDGLPFRHLPDEPFPVLGKPDHRRGRAAAFLVRDHYGIPTFHDRHNRIRGSQIDSDDLSHSRQLLCPGLLLFESPDFETTFTTSPSFVVAVLGNHRKGGSQPSALGTHPTSLSMIAFFLSAWISPTHGSSRCFT